MRYSKAGGRRTDFKVVAEPDPPEAIIRSSRTTRWVEVSTAFWNSAFAQDEFSYVTPGEKHKSIGNGPFAGPDDEFAHNFVDVVKKKLEKDTYLPFLKQYGPGYLIIPIHYPLFDEGTIKFMMKCWHATKITDLGCFRSTRVAYRDRNEWILHRWQIK